MQNNKENQQDVSSLNQKLSKLKAKKIDIDGLADFSKRLYFSSIPVVLLFTVFIELLSNPTFDLSNYLILNSITIPSIVLMNTFICGTTRSRKKKLAAIGKEIRNTESEINDLMEITKENINQSTRKSQYQIKPINRTFEVGQDRPLTKILNKK